LKFSGDNQSNAIVATVFVTDADDKHFQDDRKGHPYYTVFVTDADDKDWRRHMLPPLSKTDVNSLPGFLTAAQYAASDSRPTLLPRLSSLV
jgi:hypothetical protein